MSDDIGVSHNSVLGQLAVVLASVFYAVSGIYARKTTEHLPGVMRSVGPLLSSTLVMWPAAFLFEAPFQLPKLPITWTALLWLGMLGSGFAFILLYYLIHEIGPTRTTMVTYLFPLGGVTLGVLFLGEPLTWQVVAGAVLIILGMAFANWVPKPAQTAEAAGE
jgi:drug/metabolite transporter (DMT)-like permease